jgi:hypothetical protein
VIFLAGEKSASVVGASWIPLSTFYSYASFKTHFQIFWKMFINKPGFVEQKGTSSKKLPFNIKYYPG